MYTNKYTNPCGYVPVVCSGTTKVPVKKIIRRPPVPKSIQEAIRTNYAERLLQAEKNPVIIYKHMSCGKVYGVMPGEKAHCKKCGSILNTEVVENE